MAFIFPSCNIQFIRAQADSESDVDIDNEHDHTTRILLDVLKSLSRKLAQQDVKKIPIIYQLMAPPPPPIAIASATPPENPDGDYEQSDDLPVNGNGRRYWGGYGYYPYYYGSYYGYYW